MKFASKVVMPAVFGLAALVCAVAAAEVAFAAPRNARSTWVNRKMPAPQQTFEDNFATSLVCANCHSNIDSANNLRDEKGNGVAPFDLWQATMMANASRDPFYRAVVSAEVLANPNRKAAIEEDCLKCHAPMAVTQAHMRKEPAPGFKVLYGSGLLTDLALDGVSCTACHQISPEGLGTVTSYSGGFKIGTRKRIYGPHRNPQGGPMIGFTGFVPTFSSHVSESKLCATCHTLYTEALDEHGKPTGSHLPEQTPYLEWRNSVFSTEATPKSAEAASCQNCHMPRNSEAGVPIKTRLARTPDGRDFRTPLRDHLSRHLFIGGNTLIPKMLRDFGTEMGTLAPPAAFDRVIELTTQQLQQSTAKLEVTGLQRSEGKLVFEATVENLAGHKFPTAYPSRRAWLRVKVTDAAGKVVFVSGEYDDRGRLVDAHGKPLASEAVGGPVEPHHSVIRDQKQVQVWEAVMQDSAGKPTYQLLRGSEYVKDNRLLPRGWKPDGPDAHDTEPAGVGTDADFVGGKDTVRLEIAVPASGALKLEVEVLYQTLSWRYADELFRFRTPEVVTFAEYMEKTDTRPVTVAATKHDLP